MNYFKWSSDINSFYLGIEYIFFAYYEFSLSIESSSLMSEKQNNPLNPLNNEINDKNNNLDNTHIRGYDVYNEYLGKLSYDIIQ